MPQRPRPQYFRAEVVEVRDLSPSLRRIVFGGVGLTRFTGTGCPDEYVRVLFPAPGQFEPDRLDDLGGEGGLEGVDTSRLRTYTVRVADQGRVTLDMVLHERGVATTWARGAAIGDVVLLSGPTALYAAPDDLAWQVLIADEAGLPALARIVEQTPARIATRAVIEIPGPEHRIELPLSPADVTWVFGGNGGGPSALDEIVRRLQIGDAQMGYVWVAGESRALRGVRRYLRRELGLSSTRYKAVGYWIERAEEWDRNYTNLDPQVRRDLESLWARDDSEDDIAIEVDQRLTALGL